MTSKLSGPFCIYCRTSKHAKDFNREHVIPAAFGKFENNFVLQDKVCAACNTYFGRNLDVTLARDSLEGLRRYETGIKVPNSTAVFGNTLRVVIRLQEGEMRGLLMQLSLTGQTQVVDPVSQVGFRKKGEGWYQWFCQGKLPTRAQMRERGFRDGEIDVWMIGMSDDGVAVELKEKGWSLGGTVDTGVPLEPELAVRVEGIVDQILQRAVAKIAFNYFAYHYGNAAVAMEFEAIARYVRHGETSGACPVSMQTEPFVKGMPEGVVPWAHAVAVSMAGTAVVADVTLLFETSYRVILSERGAGGTGKISSGHVFNLDDRKIWPLANEPART